ncbi:MAG: OadG family protein [Butyricicoccus pullicaecorum]|nr:OadG family protein [Butyricicoccus pullicaecorum]
MGKLTPEALLIAASGIVIVFLVLATLCFLIPITSRLVRAFAEDPFSSRQTEQTKPTAEQPKSTATPMQEAAPSVYGGEILLVDVDEKTAACVMAIVSHETGIPVSELIFKKIKAL